MSVKLRLRRLGRKKLPVWSVVAADSRRARDGRFIEDLGRYEPLAEPSRVDLKIERIHYWLSQGAQPSHTVRDLLSREGILLEHHLRLKGTSEEEIETAVSTHRERRFEKLGASVKDTPRARRLKALEEEKERVAKEEAEAARLRAEADAKARKQAEEAKKKAAQERADAAAEARKEQEKANVAQAEDDETPAAGAGEPSAEGNAAPIADEAASDEPADAASEAGQEPPADAEAEDVGEEAAEDASADSAGEGAGDEEDKK